MATAFASSLILASFAGTAWASSAAAADNAAHPSPASTNGNNGNHGEGNNGNPSPGVKADPKPTASKPAGSNGSINGISGTGDNGHYAVTICHATRSAKNPYVVITVDASAISHLMSEIGNGHGKHTGAVFNPAVNRSGDNWGDIIPPINNPLTGAVAFPGLNSGHLDWIARGCTAPTTASVSASPSGSASTQATAAPTSSTTPGVASSATAGTQSQSGSSSGSGTQGAAGNGPASANHPQSGSATGSGSQAKSLPSQAVLPAAVPAGDGSSLDQGIPVGALGLILLFTLLAVGAAVGAARTREHDVSIK